MTRARASLLAGRCPRASLFALALGAALDGCVRPEARSAGADAAASDASAPARSTTASARRVVDLARAFEATLTPEQRAALNVRYSFANAANWSNLPEFAMRCGRVGLATSTLSPDQWTALNALLAAATGSASNEGYDEIQQILNADDYIGQHGRRREGYGRGNYHVAFLGPPTTSGRWQLQFGGHHVAINNTYADGILVGATPAFRGVDPAAAFELNGTLNQPLAQEHAAFVDLLSSFDDAQLTAGRRSTSLGEIVAGRDITAGPGEDWAFPSKLSGIAAAELTGGQRALLRSAIAAYVRDVDDEHATGILAKYEQELDRTHVSFAGSPTLDGSGDYVRVDGPSVWIELVMDSPFSFPGPHPHTVWRDKDADYGGARP